MATERPALLAAAAAEGAIYAQALRDPVRTQSALLARILADNAQTEFGRAHGFAGCADIAAFRAAGPRPAPGAIKPCAEPA